jgi:F-type H+-transporting ATPase subunit b
MHTHLATLLFQVVNFLILVAVLRYWLYRPVQAMIARRQQAVEAPLADAAAERAKAGELRAEVERQHLAAAGERDRFLLEAGRDAEARRDQLLADARRTADNLVTAGQEALGRERAAAEAALQRQAVTLAVGLAARLLAASAPDGATDRLLDEALQAVEAMDGSARDGLSRAKGPARVQVVTAVPVEPGRREAITTRLHRSLGDALEVTFAEDPALVAGAEIHLPTAVVRQSWRAQLSMAQRELMLP